jgi:uncharacterized membrane protein YidH (DUF202 family)
MKARATTAPRFTMTNDWRHARRRRLQAWLRTGLSLLVVGALITGISLGVGPATEVDRLLPWLGGALVFLGVVSSLGAGVGYRLALARGRPDAGGSDAPALILAGLIAIAGSLLALILIADAC